MSAGRAGSGRRSRSVLAPLAVAAVLAGAAVVTVERAECDVPARYVTTGNGIEMVGGCTSPRDLPLWPAAHDDKDARRG